MLPEPAVSAVLAWSEATRRDLPWRRTSDPWAILVSEAMLQQTQVARVVGRYPAFLARFPDPRACSAASAGEVIAWWTGLGYNRRAVNLHRAAIAIEQRHGGRLPDRLDLLLALPGVGPYTARAVLAFAFQRDVGVLDTNAVRVLARSAGRPLRRAEAQAAADAAVPPGRGWAWNQALLDLGATVCTARAPVCDRCPVAEVAGCAWHRGQRAGADPAVGSAGVAGRQSSFEGSDRQGRGRLVAALAVRSLDADQLAGAAGWPGQTERVARVAASLVADGLAEAQPDGGLSLP